MARRTRRRVTRRRATTRKRAPKTLKIEVKSAVLREIWAVVHLALGVFTLLSLNNSFGIVGEFWMSALKPIFGWGVQGLPFMFFGASFMLFFSKRMSFTLSRLMGLTIMTIALLSILHLYVPMDSLYSQAQAGSYGGYIGFVMNFLLQEILKIGQVGASAVFMMLLLIGILLAFEISLGAFFSFFKPDIKIVRKQDKKTKESKKSDEEIMEELNDDSEPTEEDFRRERIKAMKSDEHLEMVTIKRPVPLASAADEPVTKEVEIKNEDVSSDQTLLEDDYVWEPPSLDLLHPPAVDVALDDNLLQENARIIREKLGQFGIDVEMKEVNVGPTVIQYTLRPNEGIKLSKITALKSDLALALAAQAIRIEAPIPGKSLVGIEVPNNHRSPVHLREILESREFEEIESNLRLPIGRDVSGKPVCTDLAEMPHVLVAGATGAGKSVGINSFLLALLYQNSPVDLKLIVIDPKRVELTSYNGIPHLLTPVITDPEKAAIALRWCVAEMNRRYQFFSERKFRNIKEYNIAALESEAAKNDEEKLQKMPNIVVVIDELADLMMAAGKEVEASICRVAQMARAVGLHLIVATQRPSVDVITGLIKANIPSRIAFAVSSSVDSRTIIDGIGAEDLLGKGDMLYLPSGMSRPLRIQGVLVGSKEIERVTNNLKIMAPPHYIEDIVSPKMAAQKIQGVPESIIGEDDESLYQQALDVITTERKASASLLQRRLKLGYARAARLLDQMEENGVIGPVNGAKPREIYLD
ncbi:DNA translocase FtsK [Patescibacteria group bacterium]|nr:DNA translocase FtsK [Patescibacteria group bacterium]MBU1703197.1 DNA translocase FtsK [Patescibacteria group bacterium]MBU1953519.1 DNA translocase FtsK [Patescibacteria group bacterium]